MKTFDELMKATTEERGMLKRAKDERAEALQNYRRAQEAEAEAIKKLDRALAEAAGLYGHVVEFEVVQGYGRHSRTQKHRMRVDALHHRYGEIFELRGPAVIGKQVVIGTLKRKRQTAHGFTDLGKIVPTKDEEEASS